MEKIAATSPPAVYIFARLSTRIEFTTDKGLEINPFFCTAFIKEQCANISSLSSIYVYVAVCFRVLPFTDVTSLRHRLPDVS